jgi:saccharopine dehydrogenase (NAD+, L-lysine forming)
MKIGIIREGKTPPDKRVPLSPHQCRRILDHHPDVEIYVQESEIRKFKDEEYRALGITVVGDVSHCDVLLGVKEVPVDQLIPEKKYLFFSHTLKKQPYNRKLLKAILEKKIQLIDWETITDKNGQRLIAFGRYAGIVGAYNGFLAYGIKYGTYQLKRAFECEDRSEMNDQLKYVVLPSDFKLVVTGRGRVGGGALETISHLPIKEVAPDQFLNTTFNEPVYTVLNVEHYNKTKDGSSFDKRAFYADPSGFESNFLPYAQVANMYIACHYWDNRAPYIFTRNDARHPNWKISVVADVSCDIDCAVACTIQPSTIADPIYGYNPQTESVDDYKKEGVMAVMAVDNLPCELPKDASVDFGDMFITHVLSPLLGNDPEQIIWRATETKDGQLTPHFAYLQEYVDGK